MAIGYLHIDTAERRSKEEKLRMFGAINLTSKFVCAKLVPKAGKMAAARSQARLHEVVEALPYRVHTVLTDNGVQFTNRKQDRYAFANAFRIACAEHGIEHRLTKVNHPWPNGQVERMNWTIKGATTKRYYYGSPDQLRAHLSDFVAAYKFARRLKTRRGLKPYEYVVKCWTEEPDRFNPCNHMPRPNA